VLYAKARPGADEEQKSLGLNTMSSGSSYKIAPGDVEMNRRKFSMFPPRRRSSDRRGREFVAATEKLAQITSHCMSGLALSPAGFVEPFIHGARENIFSHLLGSSGYSSTCS
jgi:hypothetical protein